MAIGAWRRIQRCGLLLLLVVALGAAQNNNGTPASHAMSARYEDLMWQTMFPEVGDDSP
jgi:hypothetical protein